MTFGDVAFYAVAFGALAAGVAAALVRDTRLSLQLAMVTGGALAALSALLESWLTAALEAVFALAGVVYLRSHVLADDALPETRAEAELPWRVPIDHGVDIQTRYYDPPGHFWRSAIPVAAFFVIALRAILMSSWPSVARDGSMVGSVGLPHHLVAALLLFSFGFVAALSRSRASAAWSGTAVMLTGAVLAVTAAARFVGKVQFGEVFVLVAILLAASSMAVAMTLATREGGSSVLLPIDPSLSTALLILLVAVTLAILAGVA